MNNEELVVANFLLALENERLRGLVRANLEHIQKSTGFNQRIAIEHARAMYLFKRFAGWVPNDPAPDPGKDATDFLIGHGYKDWRPARTYQHTLFDD